MALDADGVHLGQDDLPIDVTRELLGSEKLIGISTHSLEEALKAENEGCDYIGIGPIYKSKSKKGVEPIGTNYIKEISKSIQLPWFAIGGINNVNISEVLSNGATRVAVIDAIVNAKNPYAAAGVLLNN